jgi:hypothetical protein
MRKRQHTQSQEALGEICMLCWQSHPTERCPLQGKECFVLYFGAQKVGEEPTSQREAQACYRSVRGKLKTSPLQVLVHQLYQLGHWYVVVIWKQEDAHDLPQGTTTNTISFLFGHPDQATLLTSEIPPER